ncbi:uncharacterized protein RJT20DRAFT_137066 [Scheffersomyces xylosifermentans]|uniref:uncharacterized protein n=1 Tax=Scheffersomyces xylosifermentans TaxID=1304137 RepID=UPI00315CF2D5
MLIIIWLLLANLLVASHHPRSKTKSAVHLRSRKNSTKPILIIDAGDSKSAKQALSQFSFKSILNYFRGESCEDDYEGDNNNYDDPYEEDYGGYEYYKSSDDSDVDCAIVSDDDYDSDNFWYGAFDTDVDSDSDTDDGYSRYEYYALSNSTNGNKTKSPLHKDKSNIPDSKRDVKTPPQANTNNTDSKSGNSSLLLPPHKEEQLIQALRNMTDTALSSKMFKNAVSGVNALVTKGFNHATRKMNETELNEWYSLYNLVLEVGPRKAISKMSKDEKAQRLVKNTVFDTIKYAHKKAVSLNITQLKVGAHNLIESDSLVGAFNMQPTKKTDGFSIPNLGNLLSGTGDQRSEQSNPLPISPEFTPVYDNSTHFINCTGNLTTNGTKDWDSSSNPMIISKEAILKLFWFFHILPLAALFI